MKGKMKGAVLPGNSTVELREYDIPTPGHGQVLVATGLRRSAAPISGLFTGNTLAKAPRDTRG